MVNFTLTIDNINPNIKHIEYEFKGSINTRAEEIQKELSQGIKKTFKEVIRADLGDSHAKGTVPLTFIRQMQALIMYPKLLQSPDFPEDVKDRAKYFLSGCDGGSIGSYSDSLGLEVVRKNVAKYIEKRDNIPCDYNNILISDGVSNSVKNLLKLFVANNNAEKIGVIIPFPHCPLYSAVISELGLSQTGYYLDESKNWNIDIPELQRAITEARKVSNPMVLVVINPGNPTGNVLSRKNIEDVIKIAFKEKLFLFADEIYQDNIYTDSMQFISFKKVLVEMGPPYSSIELASFMSCSKGLIGECGTRGGYSEIINMCPKVKAMYLNSISSVHPTMSGQSCLNAFVSRPLKGEPSYNLWKKETEAIMGSLKMKAELVYKSLNSIEGVVCNPVHGAMYAFPRIHLPPKAIDVAHERGLEPDVFYALELLENTGIYVVPGTGFGQKPGTYHFRLAIILALNTLEVVLKKIKKFHLKFLEEYS